MQHARRNFLQGLSALTFGGAARAAEQAKAAPAPILDGDKHRWAMVVDLSKCIGCQACTVSCIHENAVPEGSFRTIVSTYEVSDGQKTAMVMLPRLCNHCADAPCIPVCPVNATWQQPDGIVVVDENRCVGCAYCVQACPYDARFINHQTNKADKCTFCNHRVQAGLLPACVESCVGGARIFGDLNNPESAVSKIVAHRGTKVLRPELATGPHVFYLGLEESMTGKIEGEPTLWRPKA